MTDTPNLFRFNCARFGEVEVSSDKLIDVPEGIIGFPDFHRYAILDPSGGQSLFLWLQSLDSPDLAFIITDPLTFVPNYTILTGEPALERLDIGRRKPPALFSIATIPQDDPDRVSINLVAPLIFFADENLLYQVVLERADWPLRYFLLTGESEGRDHEAPREAVL